MNNKEKIGWEKMNRALGNCRNIAKYLISTSSVWKEGDKKQWDCKMTQIMTGKKTPKFGKKM